jgi:hypothetical protein
MSLHAGLVIPASLALLAALSAPWQSAAAATPGTGGISGTVTVAATGQPVEGALVTAFATVAPDPGDTTPHILSAVTTGDGRYTITGIAVHDYQVRFSLYGSTLATEDYRDAHIGDARTYVTVTDGEITPDIDAALEAGGGITGTIRTTRGWPIAGATACVSDRQGAFSSCDGTDASGAYLVTGFDPGAHLVSFTVWQPVKTVQYYDGAADAATATPVTVPAGTFVTGIDAAFDIPSTDTTPPEIVLRAIWPARDASGWYRGPVTAQWACTDDESGPVADLVYATLDTEGADQTVVGTCTDRDGNVSTESMPGVDIDWTPPVIGPVTIDPAPNAAGWVRSDVTASWTCSDAVSGPQTPSGSATVTTQGANQKVQLSCTDVAGNTATGTHPVSLDRTPPMVSWVNPITDGGSFPFGDVPPAPTCTATDSLSGDGGCGVTGYATTTGSHELTATALDRAGNIGAARATYTVLPWRLVGFRPPVSMTGWNVVKAGASVPLKFEVFAGAEELTDVGIVESITAEATTCPARATTTSLTSAPIVSTLAYDTERGFFTYTWKAPRTPGACLTLSATAVDGSHLTALVKVK